MRKLIPSLLLQTLSLYDYSQRLFDASLQVIDVKAGGGKEISIGEMVKQFLTNLNWFDTRWPRIPGFYKFIVILLQTSSYIVLYIRGGWKIEILG